MRTPSSSLVRRILDKLTKVKDGAEAGQWTAQCPVLTHRDRNSSLSIREGDDGRALLHCFAGCDITEIVQALGMEVRNLFADKDKDQGGGGVYPPRQHHNTATPSEASAPHGLGCTLAQYAEAKGLPVATLRMFGLSDLKFSGERAVRIPYRDVNGLEVSVRFRVALEKSPEGDNRFKWRTGSKPCLYGLWRLPQAREKDAAVVLVEGESDCHTLWFHGVDALGIPGATNWREERDAPHLDGIETIYLVIEPDQGGAAVRTWLARSRIRDRVRVVTLPANTKDPSALYLYDPATFQDRWQAAVAAAVPWTEQEQAEAETRKRGAWEQCAALADKSDILAEFATALTASGVAGEARAAKLLYLTVTSRLLDRPVSAVMKGPSSSGKSYLVERVLAYFPPDASYALLAMSEHALAYSEEPLVHRMLVIYEAAGLAADFASYLLRSLLSEGRVRYETVEKTSEGLKARLIEREGPTGVILTTTAVHLHPENETRLLSIPTTDTKEQTRAIFAALAAEDLRMADVTTWHALQAWLASTSPLRVTLPFGRALAGLVLPVATRLRRDFGMILHLIRAHALLHQVTRGKDGQSQIVATLDDYTAVRDLVADLVAEGVGATVSAATRQTVEAVRDLQGVSESAEAGNATPGATVSRLAHRLKLDKGTVSRRVRVALDAGYLVNTETRKGRPYQLRTGDALPEESELLPSAVRLAEVMQGCCGVADASEGYTTPPPSSNGHVPANCTNPQRHRSFWHEIDGVLLCSAVHPGE